MKIKVDKDKLTMALILAGKIMPSKSTTQFLQVLWLDAKGDQLKVFVTNGATEYTSTVESEIEAPGLIGTDRKLVDLVKKLGPGQISLVLKEKDGAESLQVIQGRRRYRLPVYDDTWYAGPVEHNGQWHTAGREDLLQFLEATIFSTSQDMHDEAMWCVNLDRPLQTSRAWALNGYQAAVKYCEPGCLDFMTSPDKTLCMAKPHVQDAVSFIGSLGKRAEIEVGLGKNRVFFASSGDVMSYPLQRFKPPEIDRILLRAAEGQEISLHKETFLESLDRLSVFCTDSQRCVTLQIPKDSSFSDQYTGLELMGPSSDTGTAQEDMYILDGDSLPDGISIPIKQLSEILRRCQGDNVRIRFTDLRGPILIWPEGKDDFKAMVMPVVMEQATYYEEEAA